MTSQPTLFQRSLFELIGTAMLVWIGAGSAAFNGVLSTQSHQPTTLADIGTISLAFAIAVVICIAAFGHVSGCHINPAVTLGLASIGRFPWVEVPAYVVAQLIGAILGAFGIIMVLGPDGATLGNAGATVLASGVGPLRGGGIEAANAFVLMVVIMGTAVDSRSSTRFAALPIGLAVGGIIMATAGPTGSSFNPARTLGPYVVDSLFGGHVNWSQYPVYVVGPILGAIIAAVLYTYVTGLTSSTEGDAASSVETQGIPTP